LYDIYYHTDCLYSTWQYSTVIIHSRIAYKDRFLVSNYYHILRERSTEESDMIIFQLSMTTVSLSALT